MRDSLLRAAGRCALIWSGRRIKAIAAGPNVEKVDGRAECAVSPFRENKVAQPDRLVFFIRQHARPRKFSRLKGCVPCRVEDAGISPDGNTEILRQLAISRKQDGGVATCQSIHVIASRSEHPSCCKAEWIARRYSPRNDESNSRRCSADGRSPWQLICYFGYLNSVAAFSASLGYS